MTRGARLQLGQHFRDVFAPGGEGFCALGVLRVMAQQVAVFLHGRSATGGIDHDGVDVGAIENVDQFPRKIERLLFQPRMDSERTAATLLARNNNFAAFSSQHARRGRVHAREQDALHAAGEQSDTLAGRSLRGNVLRQMGEEFVERNIRKQGLRRTQLAGKQIQQASASHQRLQARRLVDPRG